MISGTKIPVSVIADWLGFIANHVLPRQFIQDVFSQIYSRIDFFHFHSFSSQFEYAPFSHIENPLTFFTGTLPGEAYGPYFLYEFRYVSFMYDA